ncbi:MAG: hypothetical protein R2784_08095 [Saprospiraceae bacterium]
MQQESLIHVPGLVTDNCGNSTVATQTITVLDNEAPILTGVPADVSWKLY